AFPGEVEKVRSTLERARSLGFYGPGPVDPHVDHALGFAEAAGEPASFLDLGTGGGLPGLVLLAVWPEVTGVLLDSNERRTEFLRTALAELGWEARVRVLRARAEEAGRDAALRGRTTLVVSRSFGPPAAVAECAAPLLGLDSRLIVSEPPEPVDRWPQEPLAQLGMAPEGLVVAGGHRYQVLRQVAPCPDTFPRRVGIPAKRPLW
ncbi:MAG: class I SAM-dependent methyltransferase, partial [Actinomycetota bacterium]|nr:class I SAM-dependent methyltransferase [Actinomycetota bacterium]